jgi:phosphoenolpyruvate-protein kinase (PTS system EI component)
MLRLFESICYAENANARNSAARMLTDFVTEVQATQPAKFESRKGDILQVAKALRYLTKFKFLPEDLEAKKTLEAVIKAQDWEPKKK